MAGLVVPITTGDRAKRLASPPPEPFALMAAAQMHAEGRLVIPSGDNPRSVKHMDNYRGGLDNAMDNRDVDITRGAGATLTPPRDTEYPTRRGPAR